MNKTTVYMRNGSADFVINGFAGAVPGASMWNTLTNVLRTMNVTWLCLATSDDEYFVTTDDCLICLKG